MDDALELGLVEIDPVPESESPKYLRIIRQQLYRK